MEMTITLAAYDKLKPYLNGKNKMLLSQDDGVGPFSKAGYCSLEVAFDIIAVKPMADTPDYQAVLKTNYGDWYYKDYTKSQLDDNLKLDLKNNNLVLSGASGILDNNVQLKDMTNV